MSGFEVIPIKAFGPATGRALSKLGVLPYCRSDKDIEVTSSRNFSIGEPIAKR